MMGPILKMIAVPKNGLTELETLQELTSNYLRLTASQLNKAVEEKKLLEVHYGGEA